MILLSLATGGRVGYSCTYLCSGYSDEVCPDTLVEGPTT